MASTRPNKRAELGRYLEQTGPASISEAVWRDLLVRLAPISESYLRRLLRASGLPLAPLVEGVRQDGFEQLERTLRALAQEYAAAGADRARAQACRRLVIEAKNHARLVLRHPRTPPEKAAQKREMILWLLTWLENPAVFSAWLPLRQQALRAAPPQEPPPPSSLARSLK